MGEGTSLNPHNATLTRGPGINFNSCECGQGMRYGRQAEPSLDVFRSPVHRIKNLTLTNLLGTDFNEKNASTGSSFLGVDYMSSSFLTCEAPKKGLPCKANFPMS